MALDVDKLKKLPKEERLKKLKELEEERNLEVQEAKEMRRILEQELERERDIPAMDVPPIEPIDISKMFEVAGGLEGAVEAEKKEENKEKLEVKYVIESSSQNEGIMGYGNEGQELVHIERKEKTDDYTTTADQLDSLTATESAHKSIKKYTSN